MKTIYLLLFACLLTFSVQAQPGRPVVFSRIPGGINVCTNRYYLSSADKNRGRLIWVDDFDKGAMMINGHVEKLKSLKFPDKRKYGFYNKNYTVSILITSQHNISDQNYTAKGSITFFQGKRVILSRKVMVTGGCQ